jgi:lactoylglutathione lyase
MKYLHTMVRIKDIEASLNFYCNILWLVETRRKENEVGRFTLIFLATQVWESEIELTYNWDNTESYSIGRFFGHLAYEVENIYDFCNHVISKGGIIHRPPREGRMAFIKSPDWISVELLQKWESLPLQEPWKSMENIWTW